MIWKREKTKPVFRKRKKRETVWIQHRGTDREEQEMLETTFTNPSVVCKAS
jgi:hypothetical protein